MAILERREKMGGTWDLFRYPGIRSDSDMASFGFNFKPWYSDQVLAKGSDIRDYVVETAREFHLEDKVQFGLNLVRADWSSAQQQWTITARHEATGEERTITCHFLVNCAGYYNYDHGYRPHFEGEESFEGEIIHPQQWPENFDYTDRKVVVIGSGATAITVVPAMADKAAKVTMLQRSPSYILSVPDTDRISMLLSTFLPKAMGVPDGAAAQHSVPAGLYLACMRWAPDDAQGSTVPHAQESRTRRRHASLHAGLQSLGAASVRGAGRRFLQQPALRKGRHCDRPY